MNQLINFPKFFMIRNHAILTMVFFFGGLLLTSLHAQEVKVSGTVTSAADNMPLPGVSVIDAKNPTRGCKQILTEILQLL